MKRIPQRLVQLAPEFRRGASVIVVGGTQHNIAPFARDSRVVTATSATINPGPQGLVGWKTDGTGPPFRNVGKVAKFQGPEGLTLMCVFSGTDTSAIQYVAGTLNTGVNYGETLATNRKSDGLLGAGYLYADIRDDGATPPTCVVSTAAATTFLDGNPHCWVTQFTVASASSVATVRMWVDGVEQTLATNSPTDAYSQAAGLVEFDYYLNTRNLRGTPGALSLNGTVYLFGRWLTNAIDGRSLSENPQQIFASTDEDEDEWAFAAAGVTTSPYYAYNQMMAA